ncbi:hypothetical protein CCM_05980 [Cordyceps militaris CM01]|uniref:Uncharacterized protein n=1 Tax=Cordyceps militaris (strain CM01) TaxID=983644 RepID=G3JI20_CORMM|nr:uncharacterized protein CCM_05980 [Cordyceps militaris CM01]EGX91823.1 hypothetical protein CCM_05980 [Cordyceps militaris CM01]
MTIDDFDPSSSSNRGPFHLDSSATISLTPHSVTPSPTDIPRGNKPILLAWHRQYAAARYSKGPRWRDRLAPALQHAVPVVIGQSMTAAEFGSDACLVWLETPPVDQPPQFSFDQPRTKGQA